MQILPVNVKIFRSFSCLVSVCAGLWSPAQNLIVVEGIKIYKQRVSADSLHTMVPVDEAVRNVVYDLRYASTNNFTGQRLYKKAKRTFLRLPAARALHRVAQEAADSGYALKIWDAYRPYEVTKKMWDLIGDERYVANPAKGSGHNRGLAVDLTLVRNGEEVNMGTGFDNFSDTAHHGFSALPPEVLRHRRLLKTLMEKQGFRPLDTEWWHYSWPNDRTYDVLNLSFRQLGRKL